MKMDIKTHSEIVLQIRSYQGLTMNCLKDLKVNFPNVESNTLCSILSLEYQKLMKQNYYKTDSIISRYYKEYKEAVESKESPGIIVRMASGCGIAPCLVGKLILCRYLEDNADVQDGEGHFNVNTYMRNTSLIHDPTLASEIFLCTMYDDQYSPIVETMKSSLGQQYEIQLCRQITELGLAFRDEEYLRKLGYDKTPDVKLEIPVAVDGFIIHWVESKALFGDGDVHKDYIKNQYSSYWNRFGPGLVIYWFGFVESIVLPSDKRFIIRDHFPKNITTLNTLK